MDIIITEWALDSYLDLLGQNVFTKAEYKATIRPDVDRLKTFPTDPKFQNSKFWSPAQDLGGKNIPGGFKMKWHNMGPGKVQLRCPVGLLHSDAYLCGAYVKTDDKKDRRMLARFKAHLELIRRGKHTVRGKL